MNIRYIFCIYFACVMSAVCCSNEIRAGMLHLKSSVGLNQGIICLIYIYIRCVRISVCVCLEETRAVIS